MAFSSLRFCGHHNARPHTSHAYVTVDMMLVCMNCSDAAGFITSCVAMREIYPTRRLALGRTLLAMWYTHEKDSSIMRGTTRTLSLSTPSCTIPCISKWQLWGYEGRLGSGLNTTHAVFSQPHRIIWSTMKLPIWSNSD